ncbi:glycosyltransferase family 2 protein [Alkaliphilus peptidifermentans]|uniref:Glycosyltransferase, GT2 family n=1 Tax=Alkaliphilus peptidifermentans DSM 18978 TaxID=1120976 RepID=A0A1G5L5E4_9FIRM|nr:hypothetical protein [Alkaliphilus peptidifermentans]SCZ07671.1 Glycosyltransferase, GT2 family [Alkaliphilus peptidifermentans DSM 18978]
MKLAIVINVFVAEDRGVIHTFDHPTFLDDFEKVETLTHTINSINELNPIDTEVKLYIFGIDVSKTTKNDNIIKCKISKILQNTRFPYEIITNRDIYFNREKYDSDIFSVENYSTIRNQGFLYASKDNIDYLIQIDDDEILRKDYLIKVKALVNEHNDKYIFTAPYEKNGTVMITAKDDLISWKKFTSMNKDMIKLMRDDTIKESLFGFGGNMIIQKNVFETICYPEDVTRGEDFSFLLAARLIYENGNSISNISQYDTRYRSYFVPDKTLTIIHKPPYEAKKDYLFYIEKNLTRFIYDWGRFKSQSNFNGDDLETLSYYMSEMINHENMRVKTDEILEELSIKYEKDSLIELRNKLYYTIEHASKNNLFNIFKNRQQEYINIVKRFKSSKRNE